MAEFEACSSARLEPSDSANRRFGDGNRSFSPKYQLNIGSFSWFSVLFYSVRHILHMICCSYEWLRR